MHLLIIPIPFFLAILVFAYYQYLKTVEPEKLELPGIKYFILIVKYIAIASFVIGPILIRIFLYISLIDLIPTAFGIELFMTRHFPKTFIILLAVLFFAAIVYLLYNTYKRNKHIRKKFLYISSILLIIILTIQFFIDTGKHDNLFSYIFNVPTLEQENSLVQSLDLPLIFQEMYEASLAKDNYKPSTEYIRYGEYDDCYNDSHIKVINEHYWLSVRIDDYFVNDSLNALLYYTYDSYLEKRGYFYYEIPNIKELKIGELPSFYKQYRRNLFVRESANSTLKAWGMYNEAFGKEGIKDES